MCAACAKQTTAQKNHSLQFLMDEAAEELCTCVQKLPSNIFKNGSLAPPEWQSNMNLESKFLQQAPSLQRLTSILEPKLVNNAYSLFGVEQEQS